MDVAPKALCPTVVRSVGLLDALEHCAVIIDSIGKVWQRENQYWRTTGSEGYYHSQSVALPALFLAHGGGLDRIE